jgi:peroxiredoxin
VARSVEDPLVAKAFDRKQSHEDLAQAIAQLSPDEAAFFLHKLEMALRKRKIQLGGYLAAMVAWLVGMVLALIYFGMNDWSAAWAFIVPFGVVGVILYGFGTWAERVAKRPPPGAPPAPPAP